MVQEEEGGLESLRMFSHILDMHVEVESPRIRLRNEVDIPGGFLLGEQLEVGLSEEGAASHEKRSSGQGSKESEQGRERWTCKVSDGFEILLF